MPDKIIYTAMVHTIGGRDGAAKSADDQLDIKLSTPGTGRLGTNPEQLFAAGWSACFRSAMDLAAKEQGVKIPPETSVDAEVYLHLGDDGFHLSAQLKVNAPGIARDVAQAVVDRAHQICPYSKATRNGLQASVALA